MPTSKWTIPIKLTANAWALAVEPWPEENRAERLEIVLAALTKAVRRKKPGGVVDFRVSGVSMVAILSGPRDAKCVAIGLITEAKRLREHMFAIGLRADLAATGVIPGQNL